MANTGASVIGYVAFGFLADALGRKAVTIFYVVAAFLSVPLMFVWADGLPIMVLTAALSGAFVSGQYTWMAAWLPELFPTRVRATAAGFVFNMPRDRLARADHFRLDHRESGRFQLCCRSDRAGIRSQPCGRSVPARDKRQTAAGVVAL
jgi:hypothetical protein